MQAGRKMNNSATYVKTAIVKGEQNKQQEANMDANRMAKIEAEKMKENQMIKKEKIQSFMNSTKINASKLYKEKCQQNMQQINSKKEMREKQKELKAKYTVVPKKAEAIDQVMVISKEPVHVNWKQAEDAMRKIQIPIERQSQFYSDEEQSGYDSEVDPQKTSTPMQVLDLKNKIRGHMLQKLKK